MKSIVEIADLIMKTINALTVEGQKSEELIKKKAETARDYDKSMGVAVTTLKAQGEPVTIIEKKAKERCADMLYDKMVAEESLKAHYSKLERLEAQLNGFQSLNKYLENVSRGQNG